MNWKFWKKNKIEKETKDQHLPTSDGVMEQFRQFFWDGGNNVFYQDEEFNPMPIITLKKDKVRIKEGTANMGGVRPLLFQQIPKQPPPPKPIPTPNQTLDTNKDAIFEHDEEELDKLKDDFKLIQADRCENGYLIHDSFDNDNICLFCNAPKNYQDLLQECSIMLEEVQNTLDYYEHHYGIGKKVEQLLTKLQKAIIK